MKLRSQKTATYCFTPPRFTQLIFQTSTCQWQEVSLQRTTLALPQTSLIKKMFHWLNVPLPKGNRRETISHVKTFPSFLLAITASGASAPGGRLSPWWGDRSRASTLLQDEELEEIKKESGFYHNQITHMDKRENRAFSWKDFRTCHQPTRGQDHQCFSQKERIR